MSDHTELEQERDEDWEVVPVVTRRPPGMILEVRFAPETLEAIFAAAEATALNPVEFTRQAALLVAGDRALQEKLACVKPREDT